MREATTAKSPLAQVFCWRALTTDRSARAVAVVITTPLSRGPGMGRSGKELAGSAMPPTSDDPVPPSAGPGPANWASRGRQYPHMLRRYDRAWYRIRTTQGPADPASWAHGTLRGLLPDRGRGRCAGRPVDATGHPRAHGGRQRLQRDPPGDPPDQQDPARTAAPVARAPRADPP